MTLGCSTTLVPRIKDLHLNYSSYFRLVLHIELCSLYSFLLWLPFLAAVNISAQQVNILSTPREIISVKPKTVQKSHNRSQGRRNPILLRILGNVGYHLQNFSNSRESADSATHPTEGLQNKSVVLRTLHPQTICI